MSKQIILGQLNDGKEDNLYSGFGTEEVAPALQTEDLEYDEGFQVGFCMIHLLISTFNSIYDNEN